MNYSVLKDTNTTDGPGKQLKTARHALGWRLEDAAKKTSININYLRALEEERYSLLPSGLYAQKYLKKYAKVLKLPLDKLTVSLLENNSTDQTENLFGKKILSKKQLLSFPKVLRRLSLAFVIFLCVLYLFLYFKKMFFPPNLTIYSPEPNLISHESSITVAGKVEADSDLKINDETIPKDQQNNFSQTVSLKKGINNIIIKAKKKYSQEKIITRQVLAE